jgi:hypothetical protein
MYISQRANVYDIGVILPRCLSDPKCPLYTLARNHIVLPSGNGERTDEVKKAQEHSTLWYHTPIYSVPSSSSQRWSRGEVKMGRRSRSISQKRSPFGDTTFKSNIRPSLVDLSKMTGDHASSALEESPNLLSTSSSEPTPGQGPGVAAANGAGGWLISSSPISIPKLNLSTKSLPSSPQSHFDSPGVESNTPQTPYVMMSISGKASAGTPPSGNGILSLRVTPKSHSKRERERRGSRGTPDSQSQIEEKIASLQVKMDMVTNHMKDVQKEINQLMGIVTKLDRSHVEIRESMSNLRDQLIKVKVYLSD